MQSRRRIVLALTLGGAASVRGARLQSGAPKRLGLVSAINPGEVEGWLPAFLEDIRTFGWKPGLDLQIAHRHDVSSGSDVRALVADLLRTGVDVLAIYGDDEAVIAAARSTNTIPIVFCMAAHPVERGFVDSLAHPGRNLTGTTVLPSEVIYKRLEFLRAIAPAALRLAWLTGSPLQVETVEGPSFDLRGLIEGAARRLGFEVGYFSIRRPTEMESALQAIAAWDAHAISAGAGHVYTEMRSLVAYALRSRRPTAFSLQDYVDAGGLLSYGVPAEEHAVLARRWAAQIDRVLRGIRPAAIPVELPRRFELCINVRTANAMGIDIPRSVLARADKLIEKP